MTVPFNVEGSEGNFAKVTKNGEILTRRDEFDMGFRRVLAVDDVAVNVVSPRSGEKFIITGVVINGDRLIGNNGALTQLYEAAGPLDTTATASLLTIDITKNQTIVITGISMQTNQGVYLNAKADDSTVNYMTLGYFVKI